MNSSALVKDTYDAAHAPAAERARLAAWTRAVERSALQDMLAMSTRPGLLSFALGLPAAELFPTQAYGEALAHVLRDDPRAMQYGPQTRAMKSHVVRLMAERGVACDESQVFITAGAQQGMNLLTRLLLDAGGSVITEEVCYTGFLQIVEPYGPKLLSVPTDPLMGIDLDAVEALLAGGGEPPSFIYIVADGSNPLGVSLSREKRARLVGLARRYGVPVMEDDPYGLLSYVASPEPPLRALDSEWVFYVGSFSKVLAPALRAGWLVVPEWLVAKLSIVKEASDIDTATLAQRAISAYLDAGHLPAHLAGLRREYGLRRDAMLAALAEHFPDGSRWSEPTSGVFIWVELPQPLDASALLIAAVEEANVAFIPGVAFRAPGARGVAANCLRLNFSNCSPELIRDGIARLGRLLRAGRAVPQSQ